MRRRNRTNQLGGFLGRLSTETPLVSRAAGKPTFSITLPPETVDPRERSGTTVRLTGRRDPGIRSRAAVIIQAAAAVARADLGPRGGLLV